MRRLRLALLASLALTACAPKGPVPDRAKAEALYAAAAEARGKNELLRAGALAELALVFETSTHAREVALARALALGAEAPGSAQARASVATAADVLLPEEKDPAIRVALRIAMSRVAQAGGDVASARSALDAALQESPTNPGALLALARVLDAQGQAKEVQAVLERLLKVDSSNPEALERYGRTLLALGETQKALAFLPGARVVHDSTATTLLLAEALERAGRIGEAVGVLDQALAPVAPPKPPKSPVELGQLRRAEAWLLLDLGRDDDARKVLELAQADGPTVEGVLAQAQIALQHGGPAQAMEAVDRYRAELPATTRARWVATMAAFEAGRPVEARRFADEYMALALHDPREGSRLTAVLTWLQAPKAVPDAGVVVETKKRK